MPPKTPVKSKREAASTLPAEPPALPAMARLTALVVKMGFDPTSTTPPDPLAVAAALLAHMPEVAALLVFALEEEAEPFKTSGVTAAHLDGFIGLLETLCDELAKIATARAAAPK